MKMVDKEGKQGGGGKWLVLLTATICFTYTFVVRYMWTTVAQGAGEEFSLTATQIGLYTSGFFAGYLPTQIPGGILADRLQPKKILAVSIAGGGLFSALMYFTPSYQVGLVLRVLLGASCGGVMSSCTKLVSTLFPQEDQSTAMGILLVASPGGILLSNFLGTPLYNLVGWRLTFVVVGLFSLVVLLLIGTTVPLITHPPKGEGPKMLEGIGAFFSNPQTVLLACCGFMLMFITIGFATWNNPYLTQEGLPASHIKMVMTFYSIGGMVASFVSGQLSKLLKLDYPNTIRLIFASMGAMTLVYMYQKGYVALLLAGLVYGFVSHLPNTYITVLGIQKLGKTYAGTTSSIQNVIYQSSSLVQPALIGFMVDKTGDYRPMWLFFLLCVGLALLCTRFVNSDISLEN